MENNFKFLKFFLYPLGFLALSAGIVWAGSTNLTTYYPAPTGNYNQLIANNIGIGTTTPGARLDVLQSGTGLIAQFNGRSFDTPLQITGLGSSGNSLGDSSNNSLILFIPYTGQTAFYNNGSEKVRINASGNVGIGTTSPGAPLDVQAATGWIHVTSTTGTNVAYQEFTNTGGNAYIGQERNIGGGLITGSSPYALALAPAAGALLQLGYANGAGVAMTIGTTGNVGIGTTSPIGKFNVVTGANNVSMVISDAAGGGGADCQTFNVCERISGSIHSQLLLEGRGGSSYNAGSLRLSFDPSGTNYGRLYTTGAQPLGLGTNGSDAITILSGGNVGIGTTAPGSKFTVVDTGINTSTITGAAVGSAIFATGHVAEFGSSGAAGTLDIGIDSSAHPFIQTQSGAPGWTYSGSSLLLNPQGGNVGVGTTSPVALLDVAGDEHLERSSGSQLWFQTPSTDVRIFALTNGGSAQQLLLNPGGGNVGIGTTSPGNSLDVVAAWNPILGVGQSGYTPWPGSDTQVAGINLYNQRANGDKFVGLNAVVRAGQYMPSLYIATNSSYTTTPPTRLVVTESGSVGIGTTVPQQNLSVNGYLNVDQASSDVGTAGVQVYHGITFGSGSGEEIGSSRSGGVNQYGLDFYTGWNKVMSITNGGAVGIGTSTPIRALTVSGGGGSSEISVVSNNANAFINGSDTSGNNGNSYNINIRGLINGGSAGANLAGLYLYASSVWAPGTITAASDGRLKQNIKPLTNTLSKLDRLRGVSFQWNHLAATSVGNKEGQKAIGMIAQELQKVYPELVVASKNGNQEYLSIDYGKFTAVLLQAVKELKSQMNVMQDQINALQRKVKTLEKQK